MITSPPNVAAAIALEQMRTMHQPKWPAPLRRALIVSALLFAGYLAAGLWALFSLLGAWPHDGHPALFVLAAVGPGVLYRAVCLVHLARRALRLKRPWLWRLALLPVGIMAGCSVYDFGVAQGRGEFEQAFAPLVAEIQGYLPDPCAASARLRPDPARAAYATSAGFPGYRMELFHGGGHFVLALPARALDVDGATIYYHSDGGRWRIFHNDAHLGGQAQFDSMVAGMTRCMLAVR